MSHSAVKDFPVEFEIESATAKSRIVETLVSFFSMVFSIPKSDTVEAVVDALQGSTRARPRDWKPQAMHHQSLCETVQRYMRQGIPIELVTMVGAAKHLCLSDQTHADLAEAMMMRRFAGIHQSVSAIYPPGIKVLIVAEDFGERYLAPIEHFSENRVRTYLADLKALASIFASGVVNVVAESELFAQRSLSEKKKHLLALDGCEIGWKEFQGCADTLKCAFRDFLNRNGGEERLRACGFQGDIGQQQLDYYRARARNAMNQDPSDDELLQYVAEYLGAAISRHVLELLIPGAMDDEGPIPFIKASFVQHAPGTPPECQCNRVEYVAHDRSRKSNRKVAPWCGSGVVQANNCLSIFTRSELEAKKREASWLRVRDHRSGTNHQIPIYSA